MIFPLQRPMIEAIISNPYCTLGVWSDATSAQLLDENSRPLRSFLGQKGEIDDEQFDYLIELLAEPAERIKYALFWFFNPNTAWQTTDDIAAAECPFAAINRSTNALIAGDIEISVAQMSRLLSNQSRVEELCAHFGLRPSAIDGAALWQIYFAQIVRHFGIEAAAEALFNHHSDKSSSWVEMSTSIRFSYIDKEVAKARFVAGDHAIVYLEAAQMLIENCRGLISILGNHLTTEHPHYRRAIRNIIRQAEWALDNYDTKAAGSTDISAAELRDYITQISVHAAAADSAPQQAKIATKRVRIVVAAIFFAAIILLSALLYAILRAI